MNPIHPAERLQPTYMGYVRTSKDACIVLECILTGRLTHVPRRPHERERADIVRSGNVFVYEESVSGVRRWTDGVNWSPSRIQGNFLLYREVQQGYPGEGGKKTAIKKNKPKQPAAGVKKQRVSPERNRAALELGLQRAGGFGTPGYDGSGRSDGQPDLRELYGSLVDSYPFVDNGLVKKTITLTVDGVPHHLVSYYKAQDVLDGKLKTPSTDPLFEGIIPRESLMRNPQFRIPMENEELKIDETSEAYIPQQAAPYRMYPQQPPMYQPAQHMGYGLTMPSMLTPNHVMPTHATPDGLPTLPMSVPYGQTGYQFPQPSHTSTPIPGIQGIAQNGLDAMNGGQYPHDAHHPFSPPHETYMPSLPDLHGTLTPGGADRRLMFSAQNNGYSAPQIPTTDAYAMPQTPNTNMYQESLSQSPGIHSHRLEYRQQSVASQNGFTGYLPSSDPSPNRDLHPQQTTVGLEEGVQPSSSAGTWQPPAGFNPNYHGSGGGNSTSNNTPGDFANDGIYNHHNRTAMVGYGFGPAPINQFTTWLPNTPAAATMDAMPKSLGNGLGEPMRLQDAWPLGDDGVNNIGLAVPPEMVLGPAPVGQSTPLFSNTPASTYANTPMDDSPFTPSDFDPAMDPFVPTGRAQFAQAMLGGEPGFHPQVYEHPEHIFFGHEGSMFGNDGQDPKEEHEGHRSFFDMLGSMVNGEVGA